MKLWLQNINRTDSADCLTLEALVVTISEEVIKIRKKTAQKYTTTYQYKYNNKALEI